MLRSILWLRVFFTKYFLPIVHNPTQSLYEYSSSWIFTIFVLQGSHHNYLFGKFKTPNLTLQLKGVQKWVLNTVIWYQLLFYHGNSIKRLSFLICFGFFFLCCRNNNKWRQRHRPDNDTQSKRPSDIFPSSNTQLKRPYSDSLSSSIVCYGVLNKDAADIQYSMP